MLRFRKVPPTTYVLQYQHGAVQCEGAYALRRRDLQRRNGSRLSRIGLQGQDVKRDAPKDSVPKTFISVPPGEYSQQNASRN